MSWRDDLAEAGRRYQEQQQRERAKVTPEQRRSEGARAVGAVVGMLFGTIMGFRVGHTLAVELAFWLFLAVAATIYIGRTRRWPAAGLATAPLVAAGSAVGVMLMLGVIGLMTWSY